MPDVSIIIPVHNRTDLLQETLVSCLIQTYQDHEVIVVDDGSTEDVAKAVEDACVSLNVISPIRYIRQPHLGANAARNRGVKEAVGQFIQFVDSDDLLHPRKIETLRDRLVRFHHLDMAFGLDQYFRTRPGDMSVLWNTPEVAGHLDRFLWDDPPWQTGSPLWRRSALDRIGPWDVRLHCWQDWEFHIRALCRGIQYVHVPVILQYIRNHHTTRISNFDSPIDREESKIVAAMAVADELKTAGLWTGDCGDPLAAFLLQISKNLLWLDALVLKRHALNQAAKYAGGVKLRLTVRLMQVALTLSRVARLNSGGIPLGLTYQMAERLGLIPQHKLYWSTVTHEGGEVPFSLLQALDVFANRDLRTWPPEAREKTSMALFVSIIIPTLNRCDVLKNAIASAQKQNWPADRYEIIVVDNGSTDYTSQVVARMARDSKTPVRLVYEPRLGLHHARHAGVRAAAGEILIFTDDDATFDPEWVRAYAEGFAKYPEMMAAGGPVRPFWETPPPQWLLDYIGEAKIFCILSLMEPYQEFRLGQNEVFFGVNMALRRSVFDWTGFHPELFGTRTLGDGESGLNQDMARRGDLIGYIPTALVYHHIPAHRMTVDYIRKWAWHLGGAEMYVRWWNQKRSFAVLALELIRIARQYSPPWVKDFLLRDRSDRRSIDIQFQATLGWCKLHYVWLMLTDTQVQKVLDQRDFRP